MCGIFGWCHDGTLDKTALAVTAAVLAVENDRRGGHSWGVSDGQNVYRGIGEIAMARRATKLAKWGTMMGHARFATTGAVVPSNSHPFKIGPILGMHNGVVTNHSGLNARYGRSCQVDSQHIFHHIADKLPLDDISAYGAVAYIDSREPNRVFLGRFNDGELSVWRIRPHNGGKAVIWSSSGLAMDRALALAGLREVSQEVRVEDGTLYAVAENDVWVIDRSLSDMDWYTSTTGSTWNQSSVVYSVGKGGEKKSVLIKPDQPPLEDEDFCKVCGDPLMIGEFGDLCRACDQLSELYQQGDQSAMDELFSLHAEGKVKAEERQAREAEWIASIREKVETAREEQRKALGPVTCGTGSRPSLPAPQEVTE